VTPYDHGQAGSAEATVVITLELGPIAKVLAEAVIDELQSIASASAWFDVEKASAYLTCSPERIRKLVARREIPFHQDRPGGRVFFNRRELDAWLLEK
jgi:excisionase family DNA binding protein